VEDALEYQATWGAFALQTKVHCIASLEQYNDSGYLRAFFLQDLGESADAAKRKQSVSYDNLGTTKNKTKL
jgi:hypothetical protein